MAEALGTEDLSRVAQWLLAQRRAESVRLQETHDWLKNRLTGVYVPKSATAEYRQLVDQSRFNVLPLVVSSIAQNLFVDGYRPARASENARVWEEAWQPNRMDARQAGLYRASLEYGISYSRVLPGRLHQRPTPVITPFSPRRCTALYDDPINDEWPIYAVTVGIPRPVIGQGHPATMETPISIYDDTYEYSTVVPATMVTPVATGQADHVSMSNFEGLAFDTNRVTVRAHNLGVCPFVRFLESYGDLDDGPEGIVYPLLPAQRGLNQSTFGLKMAELYAAFRQRWATGMQIPEDENGNPIEPFNAAVNRVWQNESPDGRFGDFEQTDLSGYLDSRDKTLLYIASRRQIPPHTLVVGNAVSNVSAEALAALEAGHQQDIAEHKTAFGESIEQMLRLCGLAMGDQETWEDTSAQVVWRDTTPRSLGQVVDALGKMAAQLEIPPRELWERLPNVTDNDIERWRSAAEERDAMGELEELLRQDGQQPQDLEGRGAADGTVGGFETGAEDALAAGA